MNTILGYKLMTMKYKSNLRKLISDTDEIHLSMEIETKVNLVVEEKIRTTLVNKVTSNGFDKLMRWHM